MFSNKANFPATESRDISDSKTNHRLRESVSEVRHIGLAESEGTVGGDVHRGCENEFHSRPPRLFRRLVAVSVDPVSLPIPVRQRECSKLGVPVLITPEGARVFPDGLTV